VCSIQASRRVESTRFVDTESRVRHVGQNGKASYNMVLLSQELFILEDDY